MMFKYPEIPDDFLQEIRSPLAAFKLGLELLEQEKIGPLNRKQKEILDVMDESIRKMLMLVGPRLS
ncbi:MAG: histidine kinase dimerization/phospho-acceptor domain-containing protein [Patescibacteria group bacterium]